MFFKPLQLACLLLLYCITVHKSHAQTHTDSTLKPGRIIIQPFVPSADDTICWSADRRLRLDDFIGIPPQVEQAFVALSTRGIIANGDIVKKADSITVTIITGTVFVKHSSWIIKSKNKNNAARVLAMEQLKFDISKLYEEKMKQQMLTSNFAVSTFNKDFSAILSNFRQQAYNEIAKMQSDCTYTEETSKKERDLNFAAWQKRIGGELTAILQNHQ